MSTPQKSGAILIVDDDEMVIQIANLMIQRMGIQVLEAPTQDKAIEQLKSNSDSVKLAIVDLHMPGKPLDDFIDQLDMLKPGLKVLVHSGSSEQEARDMVDFKHVCGFIQKPFTFDKFQNALLPHL